MTNAIKFTYTSKGKVSFVSHKDFSGRGIIRSEYSENEFFYIVTEKAFQKLEKVQSFRLDR